MTVARMVGQTPPMVNSRPRLGIVVILLTAILGLGCSNSSQCPPPPLVPNAQVTVDVNGSRASYTCGQGYRPDSGDPTSTCTDGKWTLPGLLCHKVCSYPPTVVNANVTVNANLSGASYTCHDGHVLDSGDPTATCVNGTWVVPDFVCKEVDCGLPPNISRAFQTGSTTTVYQSHRDYQCYSGHVLSTLWGTMTKFSYVCSVSNGQAAWVAPFGYAPSFCQRKTNYEGCFPEKMRAVSNSEGIASCQQFCRSRSQSLAALKGGQCACADAMLTVAVDDAQCNTTCARSADKLCGGESTQYYWSVFTTFQGCFTNLSNETTSKVLNEVTCREMCRGQNAVYAAYAPSSQRCACYSTIPPTAVPHGSCGSAEDNSTFIPNVVLLAKTQVPNVSSCEELFQMGVYLHGLYYFSANTTTPSLCNFYDNSTACEKKWLGFKGSCYYFEKKTSNFPNAFNLCLEQDSLLVVINSAEERDFLKLVFNTADSYMGPLTNPYLGLYDVFDALSPQWVDGSLVTYSNYAPKEPNSFTYLCVFASSSTAKQLWYDQRCSVNHRAICERSTGVYGCIEHELTGYTPVHTLDDPQRMTLALCMETCRAKRVLYASVSGVTCQCLTSLPQHTRVSWLECKKKMCPRNPYQLCGDPGVSVNGTVKSFVMQDVGRPYASSCRELEVQGVYGSNLTIVKKGVQVNVICSNDSDVPCPFSFARLGGRCYKYMVSKADKHLHQCSTLGAYPVVLNTREEETAVFGDPAMLGNMTLWLVGLYYYMGPGGLFRTGSGEGLHGIRLPTSRLHDVITCVGYNTLSKTLSLSSCGNLPFVCEKGQEFVGCGFKPDNSSIVLDNYPEITPLQCVELCRGRSLRYASVFMTPYKCYCTSESPDRRQYRDVDCRSPCIGSVGRCGNSVHNNIGSIYDVGRFIPFANNCSDLYDADVLVPGTYMIAGQPTFCYMKDNSSCSLPAVNWEGVGLKGACFKVSMVNHLGGVNIVGVCKALSPPHFPASVRSAEELELWRSLSKRMKSALGRLSTHIGGVDEFLLGCFTWADGRLMTYYKWYGTSKVKYPLISYGINTGGPFMSLNSLGLLYNWWTVPSVRRTTICREAPEVQGCFLRDSAVLSPVIANYSSMGVTLCRQTCLALNLSLALLDVGSCYCAHNASAAQMAAVQNETGCDVPCPGSRLQTCASGGYLRGYLVDLTDMGEKCEALYANFVLLYNTYLLRNTTTGVVTPTHCGLSDNSACPPGFLGNRGQCYRFFPWTYKDAQASASYCHSLNSYLATPHDLQEVTFLVRAIKGIPSLSTFDLWHLGVQHSSNSQPAVGSGGNLLTSDLWKMGALPGNETCVTLNTQQPQVERTKPCAYRLPFICQARPVFQGCRNFSSTFTASATFNLSQSSRTVQQCVALCHGKDRRYALLTPTMCFCVIPDVFATGDVEKCLAAEGCGDYPLQACGGNNSDIYAVYDTEAYNETEIEAMSCDQYRQTNVTAIGQYYIHSPTAGRLRVTCGTFGVGHEDILTEEGDSAQFLASSSAQGITPEDARLQMQSVAWQGWRPLSTASSQWIQVTLTRIYALKALVLRGTVAQLKLSSGMSSDQLTNYITTLSGPSQVSEMTIQYLPVPLVAKVLRLQPISWTISPIMAFTLLGQNYSAFNHNDSYIGCFADPDSSMLMPVTKAASMDHCRALCHNHSFPFFGLRHISGAAQCGCSHTTGHHGELDITHCNATCVASRCGSDVTKSVALYRAYDLTCAPQNEVINASRTVTSAVTGAVTVTEVGSVVKWECVRAQEMVGVGVNMTATCLPNMTWSATPPPACSLVECGVPPNDSSALLVRYSNVTYRSEALYLCEGGLETAQGMGYKRTSCTHTKEWAPPPPLCADPKAQREKKAKLSKHGYRLTGSVRSVTVKSRVDCAVRCASDNLCSAYSVPHTTTTTPGGAFNCLHHVDYLSEPDSVLDSDWNVYEVMTIVRLG